jgi:hypothetical protein
MSVPEGYVQKSAVAQSCKECDFYSFKIYMNKSPSEGKCFVDRDQDHTVHWVWDLGWCPRYQRQAESTASSSAE